MTSLPPFPRLTGSADVSVRPARPADAAAIARVQGTTWRTAYRAVLPAAVLDDWDADGVTASWAAAIAAPPTPRYRVLVALERDEVVGFAAVAPVEDDPAAAELGPLLVEPRWGRRGHGSRLLAAVADHASADGVVELQAWLLETDRVSADFFESAGWAADGWARTLETGDEPLREVRWHAALEQEDEGR
ncbi:GNAT family N-acetyltransferase [Blastococcus saxobsidens]|uniref:L-amino acid N-acyltransferase YncA n=1 Tax=Blastococcus saxobsidens TaxID=138336 RepID=A0A4Q7Y930_9ACTN|nr:GNAT family N-acetyltransferase [Blastococcus saxobsidens]RZU32651.1 L-amino acid N-acyltransferase YncA [Blastococcus saxobsidens]